MTQVRCRNVLGLALGCLLFGAAGAISEGLPVFDGADFDSLVIETPEGQVARNRARIEAGGATPITRFTAPTAIRHAGHGVGQLRVAVDTGNGPAIVTCTAFLVSEDMLLTAHRCVSGLAEEVGLAEPVSIARIAFITGYDAPRVTDQGKPYAVDIAPVEADARLGYAVLRIEAAPEGEGAALALSDSVPDRVGAPLTILSHPLGTSLRVVKEGCALRATVTEGGQLTHGCTVLPGSAGAPVLDKAGRVVALHLDEAPRGDGGRAVTSAALLEGSKLLSALAAGEQCGVADAQGCAPPPDAVEKAPAEAPEPVAARAAPKPPVAEVAKPAADLPPEVFPVGLGEAGPAVYAVALPYLPPGTGVELLTGPVGALDGSETLIAATATAPGLAATVTRLQGRFSAVSLWRTEDGSLVARRYLPPDIVALALSPDGATLALGRQRADGTSQVDLLEGATLGPRARIDVDGKVLALAFAPGSARLAVGTDAEVSIWQADTGARLAAAPVAGGVSALVFGHDGRALAVAGGRAVALYDAGTAAILRSMEGEPGSDIVFSPDGTRLIGDAGQTWDVATGQPGASIGDGRGAQLLGLDPSGEAAVFLDGEAGMLRSYSLAEGEPARQVPLPNVGRAALTPDGARLIAHVAAPAGLLIADPRTGETLRFLPRQRDAVEALAFSPDSTRLALGGPGRPPLQVWAWEDGQVTFAADADPEAPSVLAWRPDGSALAAKAAGGPLRIHDFAGPPTEIAFAGDPVALAYGPDGATLMQVDGTGQVTLIDAMGAVLRDLSGRHAALSPDGATLVVGRDAPAPDIALIDSESGAVRLSLQVPFSRIGPLAWRGPESEIVGVVRTRGVAPRWVLAIWSTQDGTLIRRFGGIAAPPRALAVSQDGRFAALAEEGGSEILIWDLAVGRFLWRLETGGAEVRALRFAPDGLRVAAATAPGGVVLWDMINGQVKGRLAPLADGAVAQVGATLFLSDPAFLDRVAVRLPDGSFLPVLAVLRDGLPDFVPAGLPLDQQVADLLARLRAGDEDARLLLIDGRAMAFDLEFRRELQRQLKTGEFYLGPIDGDIGRGSRRALEQFAAGE